MHGVYLSVGTYSGTYTYINVGRVAKITENIYDATGKLFLIFRYHFLIQHINWNCMSLSDFHVLRLPRIIKENFAIFAVFIFANTKPKRIFAKLIFTDGKVLKILALKSTLKFLASM